MSWLLWAPAHFLTRVDQTAMLCKQKDVHTAVYKRWRKLYHSWLIFKWQFESQWNSDYPKQRCLQFSSAFLQPNAWIVLTTGSLSFPPFSFQQLFTSHSIIQCFRLFKPQIYVGKNPIEDGSCCCILQNNLAQGVTFLICILEVTGLNPNNNPDQVHVQYRQMPG